MIRLAADENFNNDIVRGVLRRDTGVDVVRIQDVGLRSADDPDCWRGPRPRAVSCSRTTPQR